MTTSSLKQQKTAEPVASIKAKPQGVFLVDQPVDDQSADGNSKNDEKEMLETVISVTPGDTEVIDLFVPFPPQPGEIPENPRVLTVRSMVVGSLLGCLVTASNTYLGTLHTEHRLTTPDIDKV